MPPTTSQDEVTNVIANKQSHNNVYCFMRSSFTYYYAKALPIDNCPACQENKRGAGKPTGSYYRQEFVLREACNRFGYFSCSGFQATNPLGEPGQVYYNNCFEVYLPNR
jgi:hypothetical protein